MSNSKKVAVGLSGGVDSSLSAALLVEQGYDVTGVFIECWDASTHEGCRADEDRKDALAIAMQLGIPFKVLDFKDAYQKNVLDYFYHEYKAGRTPNPDTMCNREIKFGLFYRWAIEEHNFDFIATGHYARISESDNGFFLQRGEDQVKDQSYFLYQIKKEQLPQILFPIGDIPKSQVRQLAQEKNLGTANKPDSQGICFVGKVNFREFLSAKISPQKGPVLIEASDTKQIRIGTHQGIPFYTIGQKVGREIDQSLVAKLSKQGILDFDPSQMPSLFVIDKDLESNTLLVGVESETYQSDFNVTQINWFAPSSDAIDCFVRIRHGGELVSAKVTNPGSSDTLHVQLEKEIKGVAPGQACVLYSDNTLQASVIAGGVIMSVDKKL